MTDPLSSDPSDAELHAFGYAPGNYTSKCLDCDGEMWGVDKRCHVCRPCAVKRFHKPRELLTSKEEVEAQRQTDLDMLLAWGTFLNNGPTGLASDRSPWEAFVAAWHASASLHRPAPETSGSLLRKASAHAPPGCHCTERCAAPVLMGRQQPCRDPEKAARLAAKANACQCDPNPSIGGSPPCPVHDVGSEDV